MQELEDSSVSLSPINELKCKALSHHCPLPPFFSPHSSMKITKFGSTQMSFLLKHVSPAGSRLCLAPLHPLRHFHAPGMTSSFICKNAATLRLGMEFKYASACSHVAPPLRSESSSVVAGGKLFRRLIDAPRSFCMQMICRAIRWARVTSECKRRDVRESCGCKFYETPFITEPSLSLIA